MTLTDPACTFMSPSRPPNCYINITGMIMMVLLTLMKIESLLLFLLPHHTQSISFPSWFCQPQHFVPLDVPWDISSLLQVS